MGALDLKIETWVRNTFEVQAVHVTPYNLNDVSKWTNGVLTEGANNRWYILVETSTCKNRRTTRVYVDDWIVFVNGQFRTYKHNSIELVYHRKIEASREQQVRELVEQALAVDNWSSESTFEDLVKQFMGRVMEVFEGEA